MTNGRNLIDGIVDIFKSTFSAMSPQTKQLFSLMVGGFTIFYGSILAFEVVKDKKLNILEEHIQKIEDETVPSETNHVQTNDYLVANELIINALDGILKDMQANRVFIFEYHNTLQAFRGVGNPQANHYLMTCMYDRVDGTMPRFHQAQTLKITNFYDWVKEIWTTDYIYTDVNDIENYVYRHYYIENGVKSIMIVPIIRDGNPIGHIGIEWTKEGFKKQCEMGENEAHTFLIHAAANIERVLIQNPNDKIN